MNEVNVELGNIFLRIDSKNLTPNIISEIQSKMSYIIPGYKFTPVYKKNPDWDGTKTVARRVAGGILQAPTGLYSYLKEIFNDNEIDFSVIDKRLPIKKYPGFSITGFTPYDYQQPIIENIINRQRGVAKMATGCHVKDQLIRMFDGTTKKVQELKVGDFLMGPDGKSRHVQELYSGNGKIYEIRPHLWKPFFVNEDHILTVCNYRGKRIVDLSVLEYKGAGKEFQDNYKLFKIDLENKKLTRSKFSIIYSRVDDFYGFKLNGDGRYLLDNNIVTHNSGKTEVAIASAVGSGAFPFIFYVPSCDLLEQAYSRFSKYVRYNDSPVLIGRVGGGHCEISDITVMTVQSAQKALEGTYTKFDDEDDDDKTNFDEKQKANIKELIQQAQFVSCDECHHTSAQTVQTILNNSFSARYRIGFSASPWRDDGLDILIEACFGRRLCDIDASFLINKGFLVRPQITFNHLKQNLAPCSTYPQYYKTYVVENEFRNKWIAKKALYHMNQGRMTIILVKWVRHAEILADLIPGSEILSSSGDSKKSPAKRKMILERMRNKELMCAIGTSLLDEGVDVPAATAGIFAGGGKSSTRALQRVGRFIRIDKNDGDKDLAYIEEIHDHVMFLNNHAVTRRKILSTEPEFKILDHRIDTNEIEIGSSLD